MPVFLNKAFRRFALLLLPASLLLSSCLTKEIKLNTPAFAPQMVVECYIEEGKPIRALISSTQDYFGGLSDTALISKIYLNPGAEVILSDGLKEIKLRYELTPVFFPSLKVYNYVSEDSFNMVAGRTYSLRAKDAAGRMVTASFVGLAPVKIDSVGFVKFSKPINPGSDSFAYTPIVSWTDPSGPNFYRWRLTDPSDSDRVISSYALTDEYFTDGKAVIGGPPVVAKPGDEFDVALLHISREYYNYLASVSAARSAMGNPFGQPALIKSNIQGGFGIFTGLPTHRYKAKVTY